MEATSNLSARNLPDWDRLSLLAVVILLAYTLANYISIPAWEPEIQLPGFYFSFQVTVQTFLLALVAALTAAGADWLFHDHPSLHNRSAVPHWLLPSLLTFAVGLFLRQLSLGLQWWLILLLGVVLLVLVLIGEYISIDANDYRHPIAAAGLSAASFALYLVLAAGLHNAELRLFLLVPTVFISTWLVSIRSLHLRMHGEWLIYESALIAFLVSQFSAALIYWPLSPVSFGLLLLGPTYSLNSLLIGLIEERPWQQLLMEPLIALALSIGIAFWTP
jgi:hypothetical protein